MISKQKCCSSHWFLHISGNHWNFMNFQGKGGRLSWAFYSPAECNLFPRAFRKSQEISAKIIENHYFSKVAMCPLNFPLSDQCTPPEAPNFSWKFLKISRIFLNFIKTDLQKHSCSPWNIVENTISLINPNFSKTFRKFHENHWIPEKHH